MIVVGLDFETTGLHPSDHVRVIEIGAHLYDIANGKSLAILNCFVHYDDGMHKMSPAMTKIHGISQDMYQAYGVNHKTVWKQFLAMARSAEAIMAHQTNFEKKFLKAGLERANMMKPKLKWVDSLTDIPYPSDVKSKKLANLAAYHKVKLVNAHRALPDVNAMLAIAQQYDPSCIRGLSNIEHLKVQALVTKMDKDKASTRGFTFDWDHKYWWKYMTQKELDTSNFNFKTKIL